MALTGAKATIFVIPGNPFFLIRRVGAAE